jgi:uncharacterized protein involved in exopolysaccharide biosynthesis
VQKDLGREAKQAEQNYLLHSQKREEARVADALDLRRFVNVAVVEAPTVPFERSGQPRSLWLLLSAMLAGVSSVALAFVADYRDRTIKPRSERPAPRGGVPPGHSR